MLRVLFILLGMAVWIGGPCSSFIPSYTSGADQALAAKQARSSSKVLPGLRFGMSLQQANATLVQAVRDPEASLITAITSIPLGLDVMGGASIPTFSTGITQATYHGYETLFFFQDRLIAIKRTIREMPQLLRLKQEFPSGRFSFHYFPNVKEQVRVFQATDQGRVVFTNHQSDVFIFDAALRSHVLASLTGSFCWHGKLFGPNQNAFAQEYASCVRYRGNIPRAKLSQDLAICQRFCANTPMGMANPNCAGVCQQAYNQALR